MADADPKIADAKVKQIAITPIVVEAPVPAKRRWGRIALMLSVPLLIAAVAGYFWLTGGRYVSTDIAYFQQDMVSISPDVSGRIVSVSVHENLRVKAGDVLFSPAGAVHAAKNVGQDTASELATYIVAKNKPLLTLVK